MLFCLTWMGVNKAWETFAKDYDLDPIEVAHATHGRHLYDTLKEYCHLNDEDKLQAEINRFEQEVIDGGPILLPGTLALLSQETRTRNYSSMDYRYLCIEHIRSQSSEEVLHPHPASRIRNGERRP